MFVVERPTLFHPQCLVSKRADDKHGPYIDLGRDFDHDHQGRMYISAVSVRAMETTLDEYVGEPTREELIAKAREGEEAKQRVGELEAEVESLREFERSAQYTLERFGEKVRKKPGRKSQKETANA